MSTDRTLMSIVRTALALIGFGFTIFKFFHEVGKELGREAVTTAPARNFGTTLVVLGIALIVAGLYNHSTLIDALRNRRDALRDEGLIRHGPQYRTSPTAVVAVLLLLAGVLVVVGMVLRAGPFG